MLLFQYFFCLVNCLPVAAAPALLCFFILRFFWLSIISLKMKLLLFVLKLCKVKLDFLLLVFLAMTNLFHLIVLTVLLHRATPAILEVLRRKRRVL